MALLAQDAWKLVGGGTSDYGFGRSSVGCYILVVYRHHLLAAVAPLGGSGELYANMEVRMLL